MKYQFTDWTKARVVACHVQSKCVVCKGAIQPGIRYLAVKESDTCSSRSKRAHVECAREIMRWRNGG